jgi:hypothetical protein
VACAVAFVKAAFVPPHPRLYGQDIDDALHCRVLPNGNFEVGVHIADVSHFVEHNCAMDKEAADRSNTTYLVDRRLDMLPVRSRGGGAVAEAMPCVHCVSSCLCVCMLRPVV